MAVYYCHSCGKYVDDDWHPGEPSPDDSCELICPSCFEELDEENEPPPNPNFSKDQLAIIKKLEDESDENGDE